MNQKETLSMSQARNIIDSIEEIMSSLVRKIEAKNDEFVRKVSTVWEDQNAVEYMRQHKSNLEAFISELGENCNIYTNAVKNIADAYAAVGGQTARLSIAPIRFVPNILVDQIKAFFSDSEDEFGFRNPERGSDQVMDAFNELKTSLETIAQEAVNRIRSINAFGNTQVQLNLAESAGRIVSILNGHLATASTQIANHIAETAARYTSIGSNAETAAKLTSN